MKKSLIVKEENAALSAAGERRSLSRLEASASNENVGQVWCLKFSASQAGVMSILLNRRRDFCEFLKRGKRDSYRIPYSLLNFVESFPRSDHSWV